MKRIIVIFLSGLLAVVTANAQNDCSNAVHLNFEDYSTCGQLAMESIDLGTATASSTTPNPTCGNFSASSEDLWYTITVPAGANTLAFHMFNSN
ncbi:MAG TPA: hypothetical protein PKX60_09505, partial [Prolixibacteraceae bacterium]|nr:hypothetical protein [Prolixibacteraceae bacterium]